MKKIIVLILLLAVFGTVRANLVNNPGFEDGTWTAETDQPDGWWTYAYSPLWKNGAGTAHSGTKSMELAGFYGWWWNGSSSAWYTSTAEVGTEIAATPGQNYAFSVWARGDGGADLTFQARFRDGSGVWLEDPVGEITVTTTGDWVQYDLGSYLAPAGTVDLQLVLMSTGGPNGSVFVDDVVGIPEPITISLLALGGLMISRRKK